MAGYSGATNLLTMKPQKRMKNFGYMHVLRGCSSRLIARPLHGIDRTDTQKLPAARNV
jgi:hypothetical protein